VLHLIEQTGCAIRLRNPMEKSGFSTGNAPSNPARSRDNSGWEADFSTRFLNRVEKSDRATWLSKQNAQPVRAIWLLNLFSQTD
jgi:hypothetical protein